MWRDAPYGGRIGLVLTVAVAACQQGAAPTSIPSAVQPSTTTATAASTDGTGPTTEPEPTRLAPTTDVPEGYRRGESVPFGIGLVIDGVIISSDFDAGVLTRRDAETFELLASHQLGTKGAFPPDLQSISAGTGGVWVTLASRHAVGLLDPGTGEITREVKILGSPYDAFEADGELWIADFGWGQVTRYDLETDTEVAVVRMQNPTDIIVAEGAAWAPAHIGRAGEDEPIKAGGYLARIDLATNEVDTTTSKVGPRPYYLAAGFGAVWTGTATGGSVDRVDATTGDVTTILIGEDGAFDIEVVGDSVWAVVGPQWPVERQCDPETSYFVRIDPATRQMRERIAFPCPGGITPVEGGFWISGMDGENAVSTFFESID